MADEHLHVTKGMAPGTRLAVEGELLIGRAATGADGRLGDDPELSRRHARLARGDGGELTIEDLGSSNGTFVNGERVEAARVLHVGDVVRLGKTELTVTDPEGRVPEPTQIGSPALTEIEIPEELLVVEGLAQGRRLALEEDLVIGRAESGDGRLGDDPELSRRHARVFRADARLMIEDLGSANGTFVNGARLSEPQALRPGDVVRVGRTTLEVTGERAPSAAAPPVAAAPPAPPPPRPAPVPVPARPAPPSAPPADALPAGTIFAGCRIEEVIGFGDMGVVHRAEELALQRNVALKVIRPEHSSEARFRERFRRESMAAASIDHPNVIPVLDAGEEDGVLYITMRLVDGTDLRALLEDGPLEPGRAARVIRQVGAALDAAHARGLVHRDIKPANVLLGRGDHVYLSDFGLAKRAEEAGGLTRQGSIVARAEYVAPEQILEDRVDALSDVYALGCLLYEALTAEAPYAGHRDGAMLAHVDAPPPSPVSRRPTIPRGFDEVVRRAMAKDPAERYPSAGDLGEAALVAAGEQRRVSPESVVATGPALPRAAMPGLSRAFDPEPLEDAEDDAGDRRGEAARWVVAIGFLVVLAFISLIAVNALHKL